LRESAKPQSPQKARLLGELADAKRSLAHIEEKMRQLVERIQRLEDTQERLARERRQEPKQTTGTICTMEVKNKKKKIEECKMW